MATPIPHATGRGPSYFPLRSQQITGKHSLWRDGINKICELDKTFDRRQGRPESLLAVPNGPSLNRNTMWCWRDRFAVSGAVAPAGKVSSAMKSNERWPEPAPADSKGRRGPGSGRRSRLARGPGAESRAPLRAGSAQRVQVERTRALSRQAWMLASSTSSGLNGVTPSITSSSRIPYRAPMAKRQQ